MPKKKFSLPIASTLRGPLLARMIHHDPPHQPRRDGEEMRAVSPARPLLVDQADIGLVDERRRLERVPGALASQLRARQPAQLLVDERHELLARRLTTLAPLEQ